MLAHTKNQTIEDDIFEYLKSKGDEVERDDIEHEHLSETESEEYDKILNDMKNGSFVKLEDIDV